MIKLCQVLSHQPGCPLQSCLLLFVRVSLPGDFLVIWTWPPPLPGPLWSHTAWNRGFFCASLSSPFPSDAFDVQPLGYHARVLCYVPRGSVLVLVCLILSCSPPAEHRLLEGWGPISSLLLVPLYPALPLRLKTPSEYMHAGGGTHR